MDLTVWNRYREDHQLAEETRTALARLRKLIADDPERFTRSYFTRLFTLDPSMRDLFPASLANAASGFHHVVDLVLEVAPEPTGHDEAIEVLAQLGRDHLQYGVTAEHYDLAHRALVVESAMMLARIDARRSRRRRPDDGTHHRGDEPGSRAGHRAGRDAGQDRRKVPDQP